MKSSLPAKIGEDVFRDKIEEDRGIYFVEYQPATSTVGVALINLTFPKGDVDLKIVCQAMEKELLHWLGRFPVPVMVSSFDATDDLLNLKSVSSDSHLMGYLDSGTNSVKQRWGLYGRDELPSNQVTEAYFEVIYKDIPFQTKSAVSEEARRKWRSRRSGVWALLFFVFVIPVLIEAISLGVDWLGYVLAGVSIMGGVLKALKAFGFIERSKSEKESAEKLAKMKHYYFHCEANPEAFNRLKFENFDRDFTLETNKQAARLKQK